MAARRSQCFRAATIPFVGKERVVHRSFSHQANKKAERPFLCLIDSGDTGIGTGLFFFSG